MDTISYLQVFLAFIFIISLIGVIALVLKKINHSKWLSPKGRNIALEEIFYLDPKYKVVSIRKKNKVYTMLIGQSSILMDVEEKDNEK